MCVPLVCVCVFHVCEKKNTPKKLNENREEKLSCEKIKFSFFSFSNLCKIFFSWEKKSSSVDEEIKVNSDDECESVRMGLLLLLYRM